MDRGRDGFAKVCLPDIVAAAVALMGGFVGLVLLPYLLPLGGPKTLSPRELADREGAFITVAGERLYYTHTPGPGSPVLLIHGFGGSTVSWRETIPALANAGYDVYAVDLVGFGLSEKGWHLDYSHRAQAKRVVGLMDALGIPQAVIVGHSMGGNVAARIAIRYPDRVDRLVLVSPALLDSGGSGSGLLPVPVPMDLLDFSPVRRWARIVVRQFVVPQFDTLLFDAAYQDGMIDSQLVEGYRRVLHTPDWDLGLLGIMRDSAGNVLGDTVSAIQKPVLLVWGAEDTWVPAAEGVRLEELLSHSERVEFSGVGHLPMHEVSIEFNQVLLGFLAQ